MKNINKLFATLIMVITLSYSSAFSQTESITIKSTGKMRIFETGKLKINSASGKIRTSGPGDPLVKLDNLGEIQFNGTNNTFTHNNADVCEDDVTNPDDAANVLALGVSSDNRISGLVSYSSANAQDVQSRYYTDLTMTGAGSKAIITGVFVSGDYLASGGNRTYTGDFTYDGDGPQTILGESGTGPSTNAYDNVILQGDGVKTLATGTTANMTDLTIIAGTLPTDNKVVINGTMNVSEVANQEALNTIDISSGSLNLATGISSLDGTVNIGGTSTTLGSLNQNGVNGALTINGTVNVNEFGNFNLTEGAASIGASGTLALGNFADAKISVAANKTLTVAGNMTNALVAGTNTNFDDLSTVVYNGLTDTDFGPQIVMATTVANPYGNLTISGPDVKTAIGEVVLSGNFNLQDANFDLGECDPNNPALLFMTDFGASATYGDGTPLLSPFEVLGRFRRNIGGTTPVTFNNYATSFATDNDAKVISVEFCVIPGNNLYGPYDEERDIARTIKYSYNLDANVTSDWAAEISYGYTNDELPTGKTSEGFKNSLRFRENDGSTLDEKVSTGSKPVRTNNNTSSDPFNSVKLAAIRGTGGRVGDQTILAEVATANTLFLRGGPTEFISVKDGRWSNPATWDEGEQPGPLDLTKIRTNVHIGFERTGLGEGANGQINEDVAIAAYGIANSLPQYTNRSTIAALIEINDKFGSTIPGEDSPSATLIVGGTSEVGITRYDPQTQSDLIALEAKSGSIIVKQPKTGSTENFYTDQTTFDAAATDMLTNNTKYNAGLFVRQDAIVKARNTICIEGIANNGGEVNIDEAD